MYFKSIRIILTRQLSSARQFVTQLHQHYSLKLFTSEQAEKNRIVHGDDSDSRLLQYKENNMKMLLAATLYFRPP